MASSIAAVIGYDGALVFDCDKPDGAPRKLMNSRLAKDLGWGPRIKLVDGLRDAYRDFVHNYAADEGKI